MVTPVAASPRTAEGQLRRDRTRWWGAFATVVGFTLFVGLVAMVTAPAAYAVGLCVLVLVCVAAFLRPTIGVYLVVFLTLVGDPATTPWWPFTKNLSSPESLMFTSNALVISPLEILAGVTLVSWWMRRLVDPVWRLWRGALFKPMVVFCGFLLFGILRGVGTGGDRRIAVFEARPMFYLPLMYLLITNLLVTRGQYTRLVIMSLVAVSIQSIFSLSYYQGLSAEARDNLEALSEHSATIHMAAMFVFLLAVYFLKCSTGLRIFATVLIIPVFWAFALSQRRAGMVAVFAGLVLLMGVVWYRRRRAFLFWVPVMTVLGAGFVAGTWNAGGAVGLPATAVKTVLFPNQLSAEDAGSDLYRIIEAFDLWFTIRSSPLTGVGFGQKWYQPITLPDISFFEFWEYLPHNSVLWLWLKMGFFGLVATLFLFGRAVQRGAQAAIAVATAEQAAVVLVGLSYSVMFLVFAYVDIAWGVRSTVFLAVAFALCGDFVRAAQTVPNAERDRAFELVPQ